jgi:nucleoside-diphosphate-sugar epimerase
MAERVTIFFTGAAGVIGAALLPLLQQKRVITLVHQALPAGGEHVRGDLSQPRFGLSACAYDDLCREVDVVLHCGPSQQSAYSVLELCAASRAPLLYVSSAFPARRHQDEALLACSGLRHVVARTSTVIGDSTTGETARFSGLHGFATQLLRGQLSCLMAHPEGLVDFVPQDTVAQALHAILTWSLTHGFDAREYWLCAGAEALTLQRLLELVQEAGAFVDLEVALPSLLPSLSGARMPVLRTSLGSFPGSAPQPTATELERALSASLHYLARAKCLGIHGKRYRLVQPSHVEF